MSRAPFIRRTLPVVVRGLSLGTLTAGVDGVLVGLVWLGRALTGVGTGSQLIKHVVSKKKKNEKSGGKDLLVAIVWERYRSRFRGRVFRTL